VQNIKDGYLRPVAFRGSEMMAVSAQSTTIHVAIACWPWPSYFSPAEKLKGIRLDISRWRRPAPDTEPVHAKAAGLYMICTISKHEAEAKGYADALMSRKPPAPMSFSCRRASCTLQCPTAFSTASPASR
jgi:branched-chain amino acid aminotransferase